MALPIQPAIPRAMKLVSLIILMVLITSSQSTRADINESHGSIWSSPDNSSTIDTISFKTNIGILLHNLATNTARYGFHQTTVGNYPDRIYGVAQCRGDVSRSKCSDCIRDAVIRASRNEGAGNMVVWYTWCTLQYSGKQLFGVWGNGGMARKSGNGTDDLFLASKGWFMMMGLAATVGEQPLMLQVAVVDGGEGGGGKRYGLAECRRDLSKSECRKCLDYQLAAHETFVRNSTRWEIHGEGCSMWYDDYRFYFDNSRVRASASMRTLPFRPRIRQGFRPSLIFRVLNPIDCSLLSANQDGASQA